MSSTISSSTSTASTPSTATNTIRITGMASGLDVDSLVKSMMQPYNTKVDKAKQAQQLVSWKQELYRDVMDTMNNMKSKYFDVLSPSNYLLSTGKLANKAVTVTPAVVDSNPSVSVTANGDAADGVYTINVSNDPLEALTNASISGNKVTSQSGGTITKSSKLSDIDGTITTGSSFNFTYGSNVSVSISVDANTTVSDLINKVNTSTSGKVKLDYYELKGFSLSTTDYGSSSNLTMDPASGNTFQKLGFEAVDSATIMSSTGHNGKATITYPNSTSGIDVTLTSNKLAMDGLSIMINGTGTSTVSVKQDTDAAFNKIKSFVDDYNKLIDSVNTQLNGKRDYSYTPLTDAQKVV